MRSFLLNTVKSFFSKVTELPSTFPMLPASKHPVLPPPQTDSSGACEPDTYLPIPPNLRVYYNAISFLGDPDTSTYAGNTEFIDDYLP